MTLLDASVSTSSWGSCSCLHPAAVRLAGSQARPRPGRYSFPAPVLCALAAHYASSSQGNSQSAPCSGALRGRPCHCLGGFVAPSSPVWPEVPGPCRTPAGIIVRLLPPHVASTELAHGNAAVRGRQRWGDFGARGKRPASHDASRRVTMAAIPVRHPSPHQQDESLLEMRACTTAIVMACRALCTRSSPGQTIGTSRPCSAHAPAARTNH